MNDIAIKYPSDNYQSIFDIVLNIKNSKRINIEIAVVKSGIAETDYNLKNNHNIDTIIIDSTVKEISGGTFNGSFQECTSIKNVFIPSSVTIIESYSFRGCSSLEKIIIPPSVKEIGNFAFSECTSLKKVVIPSSVIEIGNFLFSGCTSLENVSFPSSANSIGNNIFFQMFSIR